MSDAASEISDVRKQRHEDRITMRLRDQGRKRMTRAPDGSDCVALKTNPIKKRCPICTRMIKEPFKRSVRVCPHCHQETPF